MEIELARELMTVSLAHSSRLGKTLKDIQDRLGRGDATRAYVKAVGEILGWFLFEVFRPLGHRFPEIREWPFEDRDWAPDFAEPAELESAISAILSVANDGDRLADQLALTGLVSIQALKELRDLTLECRRFAQSNAPSKKTS